MTNTRKQQANHPKNMEQKNRLQGIDLLKCVAIITIPSQHFFSHHSNFRQAPFDSLSMFIQSVGMEFFLIGVPLFIAITGYLNKQTEPTWSYYRKGLKVIIPYILISIIYIFFRKLYLHESISFIQGVKMILGFNAISYAWYVEMWIGLYLLAPFLNILSNGIKSSKTSIILIITLYVMSYLTLTTNREGLKVLPGYWSNLSPLACFFFGSHIRKFGCDFSKKKLILFILFAIITEPTINLLLFPGQRYYFIFGIYLLIVPAMFAFFILYYKWETSKRWLQKTLATVSDLTLEMYLYCALCDMLLYPFFIRWYVSQNQFGLFFFFIIPLELIMTFCMAWLTSRFIKITHINRLWTSSKS